MDFSSFNPAFRSLHNHSIFSDGNNTPEEMIRQAQKVGLTCFGLSDHLTMLPNEEFADCSVKPDKLDEYFQTMRDLKQKFSNEDFHLFIGMEIDFFQENFQKVRDMMAEYRPDYLIGAVHYADDFPVDNNADDWASLSQQRIDGIWHAYFERYRIMTEIGKDFFSLFAHIDLPKKFGFMPSYDYTEEVIACLKNIADSKIPLEINIAGLRKPCHEAYPATWILDMANDLGIATPFSSDSHATEHIQCFEHC